LGGTVELNPDGDIIFTPELGGLAPGTFQYFISDGTTTAMANVTVKLKPLYQLHNPRDPHDVNDDGFVSAVDALLIINQINAFGDSPIEIIRSQSSGTIYFDVVADNFIAASDALDVINFLNASSVHSQSANQPEGEAGGAAAATNDLLYAAAVDQYLGSGKRIRW
jgi:Dockerin type I domain